MAGLVVAGAVAAVIVSTHHSTKSPAVVHAPAPAIDMTNAVGVDCGPPVAPGLGHPDPLLAQDFTVAAAHGSYTLGWEIVPYRGAKRSYSLGTSGNLLALEPATGGRPVGYGKGIVTFGATSASGTVTAVVTLNAGGSLTVGGSWSCKIAPLPTTTATSAPSLQ